MRWLATGWNTNMENRHNGDLHAYWQGSIALDTLHCACTSRVQLHWNPTTIYIWMMAIKMLYLKWSFCIWLTKNLIPSKWKSCHRRPEVSRPQTFPLQTKVGSASVHCIWALLCSRLFHKNIECKLHRAQFTWFICLQVVLGSCWVVKWQYRKVYVSPFAIFWK